MDKIIKSLEKYSLAENSPVILVRESSDNEVFVVGQKNKKIFRISKRLPIEDIKFEYEAVRWLSQASIPVPQLVNTNTGDFYVLVDGRVGVLFEFLNGSHIKVDQNHLPSKEQAYNAGNGLGLVSNVGLNFRPTLPRSRTIFSELERAFTLSDIFIKQFEGGKEFIEQVKEALDFGKSQNETFGFIHNDYRPSNIFFNEKNELTGIIDFDWSCIGPLVKDLALAAVEWSFPDGLDSPDFQIFDAFLDGYNSVAINKCAKDKRLYSWIKFATLSDAATYFCDLADDPSSTKRIIKSYMYRKYKFFSKIRH